MVPGMIGKDYFRRQAKTLRKMVKVAHDQAVAERLTDLADDFEARAKDGSSVFDLQIGPPMRRADTDRERD